MPMVGILKPFWFVNLFAFCALAGGRDDGVV
jgi:hypothetical protein